MESSTPTNSLESSESSALESSTQRVQGSTADVGDETGVLKSETRFDVLFDDNHEQSLFVKQWLDQYLGVWNRVESPEQATILIVLGLPDSRFHPCDVDWAEIFFQRDGSEARIYEFDRFENQLVSRTIEYIRKRKGVA